MRRCMKATMGLLLLLSGMTAAAWADVTATKDGDVYVMENALMRVEVDSAAGARIRSWTLKPENRDLIALWKEAGEIGGALDDRAFFTAMRYSAAIMHPGPETAVLRFEATHASGLSVLKILTMRRDSPALHVAYEWRNGTQALQRLFVRNFFLPGDKPQTDQHQYWVSGQPETGEEPIDPSGYYVPTQPEYAALWDAGTGDGIAAHVPGVDKYYFWRGSKEFPTFEWLHEDVPAGKTLRAQVLLVAVHGQTLTPDWKALITDQETPVRAASLVDLPGWVDEATQFGVTDAEKAQGFWLSTGEDSGKQRVPDPLPIDLPLGESRHLQVTINLLQATSAALRVRVPEAWQGDIQVFRETPGKDRKELLPIPTEALNLEAGTREDIWLRVGAGDRGARETRVPIELQIGNTTVTLNLQVHVWPVRETTERPFHVRGYCGGWPVWAGGYDVEETKLRDLEAILRTFADIGGDVLDWNGVWARILTKVKIAGTDKILTEVSKTDPESLDLNALPELDFSYYDPWFELAGKYGVTRLETYMMHPEAEKLPWYLLGPAVGDGRVEPGTPEAEKVMVWYFGEMKRYLESRGQKGFFCKISDEISPEEIPAHIETAKLAQQAGWRPFTTITGMIARTAAHLETMDPYCDQWQLAFPLKDDFLALRDKKYKVTDEDYEIPGDWGHYTNGGAIDTWGKRIFGEGGVVPVDPGQIEEFQLLEDGEALKILGGSPWGNEERGVVITGGSLNQHLYVSAVDGSDPEGHTYTLRLKMRREAPDGQPLISIDPTDEVWCYGGGSRPFRAPYKNGYRYPIMALHHGFQGYGLWAFYHWNQTERIMWIDQDTGDITVSPVYCGYRDGWHDALLFSQVIADRGRDVFAGIVGTQESASLKIGEQSHEVYNYTDVTNAGDPLAINEARRRALELLNGEG